MFATHDEILKNVSLPVWFNLKVKNVYICFIYLVSFTQKVFDLSAGLILKFPLLGLMCPLSSKLKAFNYKNFHFSLPWASFEVGGNYF